MTKYFSIWALFSKFLVSSKTDVKMQQNKLKLKKKKGIKNAELVQGVTLLVTLQLEGTPLAPVTLRSGGSEY